MTNTPNPTDLTKIGRLKRVLAFNLELTSTTTLEPLLQKIVTAAAELTHSEMGALLLLDESGENLRFVATSINNDPAGNVVVPLEGSIAGAALVRGQPVVVNDAASDPRHYKGVDEEAEFETHTLLAVPLLVKENRIGTLEAVNKHQRAKYTADDIEILTILAAQAAVAIENARLIEAMQAHQAELDRRVKQRTAELSAANEQLTQEIQDRRHAEQEALQAKMAAEAANQAKSEFLARMSHELRTPLNAILGFAQVMIHSESLPQEHHRSASVINRSGEHLLALINQVLDVSKIEAGRMTLNEKNIDLYQLVDHIIEMFTLKAQDKGLRFKAATHPSVPRYIRTDEMKLRQVLINLLGNAIKFTASGHVSLSIKNTTQIFNPGDHLCQLHFSVQDTGPGIAADEMDALFESFRQTESGRRSSEGTGLGLSISQNFIQLMGGQINVESEPGRGSTFSFIIQAQVIDADYIAPRTDVVIPRRETPARLYGPSRASTRTLQDEQLTVSRGFVLIVDDVPANLEVLNTILSQQGYQVQPVSNGRKALEIVQETPPDLILLDIMMPDMDGYEVCRRLKDDPETAHIPVIFISAVDGMFDKLTAFSVGGVDYITKPFHVEEVVARVRTQINMLALNRELKAQNQQLQIQNQELDAFAHTVAHDLKNPLSKILPALSMLEEYSQTSLDESAQMLLNISLSSGHKMVSIIDELLLLSNIRKGDAPRMRLDMSEIVAQALNRVSHTIENTQAEIYLPEMWPLALGYAPWIEEVWMNYISNALKYGGQPPRIWLGGDVLPGGDRVRFWVRDNGMGVSQEYQGQLFTEFTRLNRQQGPGHGLGLSIVRRIIDKMGGQVGLESQVGEGCTFYFTLPCESV